MQFKVFNQIVITKSWIIWCGLLLTFALDPLFVQLEPLKKLLSGLSNEYITTCLLSLAVIIQTSGPAEKISVKIEKLQAYIRTNRSYSILIIIGITLAIIFEILYRLENIFSASLQQFYFLYLVIFLVSIISLRHLLKDKRLHDMRMRKDICYKQRQLDIQNLILILFPAILCRIAALIAAFSVHSTNINLLSISQYFVAIFLFCASASRLS